LADLGVQLLQLSFPQALFAVGFPGNTEANPSTAWRFHSLIIV
jgi:hypothetical protein